MGSIQKHLPDFAKRWIKKAAYGLYDLTDLVFQGSIDKYDPQTLRVLKQCLREDSNTIDIGAHLGHILREILKAAPKGKHLAIEPIPHLYQGLQKKFGHRVKVLDCALSDEKGTAEFNLFVDKPALSGLKKRTDFGNQEVKTFSVQTERLDDLVSPNTRIDLIKIDVEGAEMIVLQGAKALLKRDRPIVLFEFSSGGGSNYHTVPEKVYDIFAESGMQVSVIEYFLKKMQGLSREEFVGQYRKGYNYFFIAYDEKWITRPA